MTRKKKISKEGIIKRVKKDEQQVSLEKVEDKLTAISFREKLKGKLYRELAKKVDENI